MVFFISMFHFKTPTKAVSNSVEYCLEFAKMFQMEGDPGERHPADSRFVFHFFLGKFSYMLTCFFAHFSCKTCLYSCMNGYRPDQMHAIPLECMLNCIDTYDHDPLRGWGQGGGRPVGERLKI
jgi:hypothetical protein